MNLLVWECGIPGKKNTDWDGGIYKMILTFPEDYPTSPPLCTFKPALFHPNVYPSGNVCLSIINAHEDWKPSITIKQILLGIQELLDDPNLNSPANGPAFTMLKNHKAQYTEKVREQAKRFADEV